jgi:hypothetical protein
LVEAELIAVVDGVEGDVIVVPPVPLVLSDTRDDVVMEDFDVLDDEAVDIGATGGTPSESPARLLFANPILAFA